jgi:anti-sigma factor RsiW
MKCNSVQEQLLLHLNGELMFRERRAIDRHLAECAPCRKIAEELVGLQEVVDRALDTQASAPESLNARVMAVVRKQAHPRWGWIRLPATYKWRQHFALTGAALFLLFCGYGTGYWQGNRQNSPGTHGQPVIPTILPDTDPFVRIKRLKSPHLHPIPFGRIRTKKV